MCTGTFSHQNIKWIKHGASLHNRAEGLSLSLTNPNETISLAENWNQLAYFTVAWSELQVSLSKLKIGLNLHKKIIYAGSKYKIYRVAVRVQTIGKGPATVGDTRS